MERRRLDLDKTRSRPPLYPPLLKCVLLLLNSRPDSNPDRTLHVFDAGSVPLCYSIVVPCSFLWFFLETFIVNLPYSLHRCSSLAHVRSFGLVDVTMPKEAIHGARRSLHNPKGGRMPSRCWIQPSEPWISQVRTRASPARTALSPSALFLQ